MSKNTHENINSISFGIIRTLRSDDAQRLYAFYESLQQKTKAIFGNYEFTQQHAQEISGISGKDHSKRYYIVTQDDNNLKEEIVGLFWFWQWTKKVPWFGIMITDAHQGRGLGRKMMAHAISEAECHGKGGILLTTAKTNVNAQALYKRYDFEIIGEGINGEHLMILNFIDR